MNFPVNQIVIVILLIVYLLFGLVLCSFHMANACRHSLLALISTLATGVGLVAFRLLRGVTTRRVKYIHFLIQSSVMILITGSLSQIRTRDLDLSIKSIHAIPGYVILILLTLQYILAVVIFIYVKDNRRVRLYIAPLHDIIGICLFVCMVGTCLSGSYGSGFSDEGRDDVDLIIFNALSYCAFLIIVFIVLCPFFDWGLVGPI